MITIMCKTKHGSLRLPMICCGCVGGFLRADVFTVVELGHMASVRDVPRNSPLSQVKSRNQLDAEHLQKPGCCTSPFSPVLSPMV